MLCGEEINNWEKAFVCSQLRGLAFKDGFDGGNFIIFAMFIPSIIFIVYDFGQIAYDCVLCAFYNYTVRIILLVFGSWLGSLALGGDCSLVLAG